ncbi:nickel pincer cofactor biosynthesis protein LarB [Dellaglioa algida]|uniref:nickel pincer cofactor biosynthesis protein LarB n=1 Tax=Dellaglioa algida TaxID=105612 RepID=UPI0024C4CF49|nr:nickel pincer cofactor biosynthesis protein LarB [Dellaglioa algida]MDK1728006.1 nickel pincer cofactor biosynthesis protein LarB [Dellaglioa algida]MDK1735597.1 nickel pincer cofactor biosynthesis protein LarB [Dellaglioa algida]MDK1737337.1 nickel pincer cofactor biosynthesis protein LarB [Dellaglioa algida]
MEQKNLKDLLMEVAAGRADVTDAMDKINNSGFAELDFAKVDLAREKRNGYPEVIYGEGKTAEQIVGIMQVMTQNKLNILGTRISKEKFEIIKESNKNAIYFEKARCVTVTNHEIPTTKSYVAIVTAGTSDMDVAEEAAITAETYGNKVERVYDVGVAGISRLFNRLDVIQGAKVVIVIAGMEGALASVVGGLIDSPLIAVPTSVGYGTSFGGVTPLLTMLNSCASGITVVNIDNGFGAGYSASMMNHL